MKRVRLTEVLMTIPVLTEEDEYDVEIEDELFGMFDLCAQVMAKASSELAEIAGLEEDAGECTVTVMDGIDWENASLEDLRSKPERTRKRH